MRVAALLLLGACSFPSLPSLTDGSSGGDDDGAVDDGSRDDAADTSGCPAGYTTLTGGGVHRYRVRSTVDTWTNHRDACGADTTYLAVPGSAAELSAINSATAASRTWIGVSDVVTEGSYVTVQGFNPPYVPWGAGEPDNGTTPQHDCVAGYSAGTIATEPCNSLYVAVCECDAALTLTLTSIRDGDTGVSRTADFVVNFNASVVPSTIADITMKQGATPFTSFTKTLSASDTALTLHWTTALAPQTVYSVTFPLTLQDTLGRVLEAATTVTFITGN